MIESRRPDISVIVATRNRAASLLRMLASVAGQALEQQLSVEVIVVENGSKDHDRAPLPHCAPQFVLRFLSEDRAGKSRALNRALDVARGDVLAFTDDDVTACPQWLPGLHQASLRFPSADLFCGPIIPAFPADTPEWLQAHVFADALFGRFDPKLPEGLLPRNLFPFGANFAVRSSAVGDKRFRLDMGPSQENGSMSGEDTEFVERIRCESGDCVYVPDARVVHHVRDEQIAIPLLFERAFQLGRGHVAWRKTPLYVPARFRPRDQSGDPQDKQRFDRGGFINYYSGQFCELRHYGDHSFDAELRSVLEQLQFRSYLDLLCDSALAFYGLRRSL